MINTNDLYFDSEKFIKEMEEHEGIEDLSFDYEDVEIEQEERMRERDLRGGL